MFLGADRLVYDQRNYSDRTLICCHVSEGKGEMHVGSCVKKKRTTQIFLTQDGKITSTTRGSKPHVSHLLPSPRKKPATPPPSRRSSPIYPFSLAHCFHLRRRRRRQLFFQNLVKQQNMALPFHISLSRPLSSSTNHPSDARRVSSLKSLFCSTTAPLLTKSRRSLLLSRAGLALDSAATATAGALDDSPPKKLLLEVKDLTAVITESRQEILRGVNLTVYEGEIHAIMGKNGSGKSTFSKVLVGHPHYEVTGGSVTFKGENLLEKDPVERSHAGLFMSFQSPVEIPGVSNMDFLLMAYNARLKKQGIKELEPLQFYQVVTRKLVALNIDPVFLNRNVNEGFSGGERKLNEILQLSVLEADLAILDEIDSGLDVDALQTVAKAVNGLLTPKNSTVMITHYQRLLDFISPTYVHIMEDGRIVKTGDISIAKQLEKGGYKSLSSA